MQAPSIESRRRQRGDALLEAMIAMILMATIGLGLAYAATRAVNAQRYANTQTLALQEMREELQRRGQAEGANGLCASGSESAWTWALGNSNISFTLQCASTNITVNGTTLTIPTLRAVSSSDNDASRELFGGDGEIMLSLP